jgi:hypothetical protein
MRAKTPNDRGGRVSAIAQSEPAISLMIAAATITAATVSISASEAK